MTIRYLIIESDDLYSSDYDYVDYLLDIEYKNSPSTLIDIPMSDQDRGEFDYYDSSGSSIAEKLSVDSKTPIGKLVY